MADVEGEEILKVVAKWLTLKEWEETFVKTSTRKIS